MTNDQFNEHLTRVHERIDRTLKNKAEEYARQGNRLYNFQKASEIMGTTKARALLGMIVKHWVSVLDLIDDSDQGNAIDKGRIDEKIGDTINYLILLEAILLRDSWINE